MNDDTKPQGDDGHSSSIAIDHLHFSVLDILNEAVTRFKTNTGKDAKYFYAPEALLYLIDGAVKARAFALTGTWPAKLPVVNVYGLELVAVPGSTCVLVTAEPLHKPSKVPPTIVSPMPKGIQ